MDDMRFADIMQRERDRLNRERQEIVNQQKDLENKLTEINHELAAIDCYRRRKPARRQRPVSPCSPKKGCADQAIISGYWCSPADQTRREAILKVIGENPSGLSRGEILERIGLKGNKYAQVDIQCPHGAD